VPRRRKKSTRILRIEPCEPRRLLAGAVHNSALPADVNDDGMVSAVDALVVINHLAPRHGAEAGTPGEQPRHFYLDVNHDQRISAADALVVINSLAAESEAGGGTFDFSSVEKAPGVDVEFTAELGKADQLDENLLAAGEVATLLSRASIATARDDAIIAVVDRSGRILGVRVEEGVSNALILDDDKMAFAIDGAVAKARTAAFFSSNAAPLTSRTIRFISQSTITQREVESSPLNDSSNYQGPGLVAPIGVGGHFPPEVAFTPQVDLFAIEHQSRDGQFHPGADNRKGTGDDFTLNTRFNADPAFIPAAAEQFFSTWPESYGVQSGTSPRSISRGIATLPGGIPLYKTVPEDLGGPINLVGGIGVFFPGEDGFATHEQGFRHQSENGGQVQSEKVRTNADLVLQAEAAALLAAAGEGLFGPPAFNRDLSEFNDQLPELDRFIVPISRIDLVGITLEIFGPHPDRSFRQPGIDRLIDVARRSGITSESGTNHQVHPDGRTLLDGQGVPEGWLVAPHDSPSGSGLTAEQVEQIIDAGREEADRTRAAIRLNENLRPGVPTRMVLAVADTDGELLGLFRMKDATIFSIDVSVAKARNTAYYADAVDLVMADRVDFDGDGVLGNVTGSIDNPTGDTLPLGTALTNRTFRFLAEPRFPTGSELPSQIAAGLVNDRDIDLCDAKPLLCTAVGPQSSLRLPGINPKTGENIVNGSPLSFDVYASADHKSTVMFDSFNVSRNFRDPGDAGVKIAGSETAQPLANQNGVVFFPGSTPLYVDARSRLAGGFGVSGDGVDQDDVVTNAGQQGFDPLQSIRVDSFTLGGVRIPYQKFNRNPFGD